MHFITYSLILLFHTKRKSMVRKTGFILLMTFMGLLNTAHAQKYVKYIFQDNKIKFVLPVDFKELKNLESLQEKEVHPLIRAWQTKDRKAEFLLFMPEVKGKSNLENDMAIIVKDFSFYTNEITILADRTFKINNKQNVILHTVIADKSMYFLINAYFEETKMLVMCLKCEYKKQKKYDSITKEVIKSLTLQ